MMPDLSQRFPHYTDYSPLVPTWCVTPHVGRTIHRFFDTSPFSPSGRYLALFRLPFEDHVPEPGDIGHVVLVDLDTGDERVVAETRGWETQVGANVQWGTDDTQLFFNDVDLGAWEPFGVKLDPLSGETRRLEGGIWMISPNGRCSAFTCLRRMRRTQLGYGVMLPDEYVPQNVGLPDDDGLFITDTTSGECKLLISIEEMVETATPKFDLDEYRGGEFYGFQCKWNPQGTRLIFVLRWLAPDGKSRKNHVLTVRADGTDVHLVIPAKEWAKGGHHINWRPDGESISMNLNLHGDGLRFITARYDGTGLGTVLDTVPGSGHPTVHPNGQHILTDAYLSDTVAFGDGTVPIRLVDTVTGEDRVLVRMRTDQPFAAPGNALRVDPHPAWDAAFRRVALNGFADGTRRVYVADLEGLVC